MSLGLRTAGTGRLAWKGVWLAQCFRPGLRARRKDLKNARPCGGARTRNAATIT